MYARSADQQVHQPLVASIHTDHKTVLVAHHGLAKSSKQALQGLHVKWPNYCISTAAAASSFELNKRQPLLPAPSLDHLAVRL